VLHPGKRQTLAPTAGRSAAQISSFDFTSLSLSTAMKETMHALEITKMQNHVLPCESRFIDAEF
jgi:hypothetical protein